MLIKCKECGAEVSDQAEACPKCNVKISKPGGHSPWAIGCFGAAVVIFLMILLGSIVNNTGGGSKAPDANDIVHDPKFANVVKASEGIIRLSGFECPEIHILRNNGESALGLELEAYCGPLGGTNIYSKQHYAVYPEKLRAKLCPEFDPFGSKCE